MDDLFDNPSNSGGVDDFDFDAAASAFPDIELDGDLPGPIPTGGVSANASAAELAAFAAPPLDSAPDVRVTGGDEIDAFEEQFPDIGGAASPPPPVTSQPTFGATPTFAPRPQPSAFATPILNQPIPDEEESEAVKAWREKQAEEIARRDAVSKEKREETKAKAEQSIDKFYEEYNAQKERTIRTNKQEELDYTSSLTDALSAGTTWSRICSLVELENSQSKSLARTGAGTTDLSRFKEVLLRLKRDGDSAPGAAGY